MTTFKTEDSIGPLLNSTENFLDQFKGLHLNPKRKYNRKQLDDLGINNIQFMDPSDFQKTACREQDIVEKIKHVHFAKDKLNKLKNNTHYLTALQRYIIKSIRTINHTDFVDLGGTRDVNLNFH